MKNIREIINLSDLSYYKYNEELNILEIKKDTFILPMYQQRELISIVIKLEDNNINYKIDEKDNIILRDI